MSNLKLRKGAKYVNSSGAVLEILGNYQPRQGEPKVLSSDIFEAVSRDRLFGPTYYLVTEISMEACGYKEVECNA